MGNVWKTRPVMTAATVTALLSAIYGVLAAFDIYDFNDGEQAAVAGLIAAVALLFGKGAASNVFVPTTVQALVEAEQIKPAEHDAGYLTAAIYSERLGRWSTVFLRTETTEDEGTFVLNGATRDGLPVAEYRPDRSGTHLPVGPEAMSELGLRPAVPPAPGALH